MTPPPRIAVVAAQVLLFCASAGGLQDRPAEVATYLVTGARLLLHFRADLAASHCWDKRGDRAAIDRPMRLAIAVSPFFAVGASQLRSLEHRPLNADSDDRAQVRHLIVG